ncbi:MAG: peptide chain release factor N(5)-glutamine methyltransferase [Bacteroidota bacterium]
MNLTEIKNIFYIELENLYPKTEIESFFYLLTEDFIGLKRVDIALDPKYKIDKILQQKFISALAKLKNEYPIQYIIGKTEFYGLPFKVNNDVLIPRPETEELVQWVINETQEKRKKKKGLTLLDIGTGSGCIAIALAKNLPDAEVWALDISDKALKIAKENAKLNTVNIQFLNENILKVEKLSVKFDIIISNPPYVRELEKSKIQNNVLLNEPHLALFVKDEDPLLFYDKIAGHALEILNQNGMLFFEINQDFGKGIVKLLKEKGFQNIELKKDIFGVDRMVKADLHK